MMALAIPQDSRMARAIVARSTTALLISLLIPALLPKGDESAMNFEAVRVFLHIIFPATFLVLGVNFAENVASPPIASEVLR
jgi:hypothetical protein